MGWIQKKKGMWENLEVFMHLHFGVFNALMTTGVKSAIHPFQAIRRFVRQGADVDGNQIALSIDDRRHRSRT